MVSRLSELNYIVITSYLDKVTKIKAQYFPTLHSAVCSFHSRGSQVSCSDVNKFAFRIKCWFRSISDYTNV